MDTDDNKHHETFELKGSTNYASAIGYVTNYSNMSNFVCTKITASTIVDYKQQITSAIDNFIEGVSSINTIGNLLPTINPYLTVAPMLDATRQATISLSNLVTTAPSISSIASIVGDNYKPWFEETILKSPSNPYLGARYTQLEIDKSVTSISKIIGTDVLSQFSVQSSIAKMTELSVYAESSLASFDWDSLGSKIELSDSTKKHIGASFGAVSDNYSSFLKSLETNPVSFAAISPALTRATPVEYYTATRLLETLSCDEELTDGNEAVNKEIQGENEGLLAFYLPQVHTDFIKLWRGAVDALNSSNPDRVRHFSISIRELFTHIMHSLAPEERIKKWSSDPSLYEGGKPTRKARLLFICRNISSSPLNKFIEKDVIATLEFLRLFHEGAHAIAASFNEYQLIALKAKAESTIKFILEIEFKTNQNRLS